MTLEACPCSNPNQNSSEHQLICFPRLEHWRENPLTSIDFPSYDNHILANARPHHGAILRVIIHNLILPILDEISGRTGPGIRKQTQRLEFVTPEAHHILRRSSRLRYLRALSSLRLSLVLVIFLDEDGPLAVSVRSHPFRRAVISYLKKRSIHLEPVPSSATVAPPRDSSTYPSLSLKIAAINYRHQHHSPNAIASPHQHPPWSSCPSR